LINAVSYLFKRKEIPPMVIRHIYLYCLDTVGRNARFGIGGTSKYAARLVGNWLDSYRRTAVRGMKGNVCILDSSDGRSPNLKIKQEWLDQPDCKRFCLGPVPLREALLIRRLS
jgi:hypothetical protein